MDVVQLKNSLEKIIAILPGSRDREGSPVIVFPSHGDFVEYPFAEVVSVISYLSQIPDDKSRAKGFTVLIDMRRSYIKYLKTILKAIQHVLYGRVRQVIIVKPEHFIEKQRINIDLKLEVYEFKIHFVSAHKLTRHIELGQLPIAFAGSYPYDHKKWLDLRNRYESFLKDGSAVLRQVEILENPNLSKEEKAKQMSSEISDKTSIPLMVDDLLKRGQKLVTHLKGESEDGVAIKATNPEYILAAGRIETLMQQLKSDRDQLNGRTFEQLKVDKEKNEKIIFEQFLIGVNNITEWLLGPGEKWLLTLHEIGESRDEAEQLKRDHDQLHQKTQEILSQVSDVKLMADELLTSNDPQSVDVMKKRDYLDSVSKAFSARVKRQRQIIQMSFSFHSLVDEYSAKLDELLDSLCSDTAANDVPSSENAIQILDVRLNAIEKAYVEVMMEGQNFLDHLQVREQNSLGYEVTRDYLPGIVHVRRTLGELQDRKQRSNQLADVRRLKLQQILQLFTCERDADQAIKWLYELCETLAYQYTKIGTTPNEVASVRKDHQKLEQTARSTYEYGKQLMQVSLVLRRSLRYEMAKNYELSQRLDEAWAKFCKALSERATRLNISQVFYSTIKQVNNRLEDLCSAVNEDVSNASNVNVVDSGRNSRMEQYDSVHKQLVSEVRELKYMAQALIERMEQPVVSLPGSVQKDIAYVDKKAMEEIRHRLAQEQTVVTTETAAPQGPVRHIEHHIYVEHIPIPAVPVAPVVQEITTTTTTLDEEFIHEIRETANYVTLRVDEMVPNLLEPGNNLEDALRLQKLHSELQQKLLAKQSNIEELLSKADQLVSEQPEKDAAVYEAMADSLGSAWKDLNRQLQLRANLLENSVNFYNWAKKHQEQMDQLERYLQNLPRADSQESVKNIIKKHNQLRRDLLDAAVEVMTFGQVTIEKIREMGTTVDNLERSKEVVVYCSKIEDVMLRINDRRKKLEATWDDKKVNLEWSSQATQIFAEMKQIEDWLRQRSEALRRSDLGDSEPSAEILQREHEQVLQECKNMLNIANRLQPMAEQLLSIGYDDGGDLQKRCGQVKEQLDGLLNMLENRRQLLHMAVNFFRSATTALHRLDTLEGEIKSFSLSRHKDTIAKQHAELSNRVNEATQPAVAQGRAIVQRVGPGAPGASGVERKLAELERRLGSVDQLCSAHRAEALAKSQQYQDFLQQYASINTWLVNIGEASLYSLRDMGTTLATVNDFLERHRQLANDIRSKEYDVSQFLSWTRTLEGQPGDPDYEDMRRKAEDVRTRWDRVKSWVDNRVKLGEIYYQFHRQAVKLAADMDTIEAMIKTSRDVDYETQRQFEDLWTSLSGSYQQLKNQGEKFLTESRVMVNDPNLDVKTAQRCVETLLEQFGSRHIGTGRMWTEWQTKCRQDKEFQQQWQSFVNDCRKCIHYVSELRQDMSLAFTHFEHPPAVVADRQERALNDFRPRAKQAQHQLEGLLKTAETIGTQGETRGEKERLVAELLETHQQLQQSITQFEVLTSMTVTFFRNLHQLDEWIDRVREKFRSDRMPQHDSTKMEQLVQEHRAASQTVEELVRFARNEGDQIVRRSRQPDVSAPVRSECDKIPALVEERVNKWNTMYQEQHTYLDQYSSVAKFEREIIEVIETIETLTKQVHEMRHSLGLSPQAAQAASREFREVERRVNQTDHRVTSVVSTAESWLSGPYRGNQRLRQNTEKLKQKWSEFRRELDDFRTKLSAAETYWTLVDESEYWIRETTEYIVDVGRKTAELKTSEQANQLMGQLETYMKPKQRQQEERIVRMEQAARTLYGEEAEHKVERQKRRYKEIVDSFHVIGDQLFSLAETFRTKEVKVTEIRQEAPSVQIPQVPPKFVQHLKEGEVTEGSRFEFMCRVTGHPAPDVTWYKDGIPVSNNPDYETTNVNGVCVLKIEETFTEDSAVFTCRATNLAGTAETQARLTVKESPFLHMQPPEFITKLENSTVHETESHSFECHVTGHPAPVISWFKNDRCIDNSPDYRTSFNNGICRMTIEETFQEDEARYTCRAVNPAGEAATSAKLTVLPRLKPQLPPKFVQHLQSHVVVENNRLMFEARVTGDPTPDVQWYKNDIPLSPGPNIQILKDSYGHHRLVIERVTKQDAGTYSIRATNPVGEAKSSASLQVNPPPQPKVTSQTSEFIQEEFFESHTGMSPSATAPSFVKTFQDVNSSFGSRVKIDCILIGNPRPKVTWLFNGRPLTPSSSVQLTNVGDTYSVIIPQLRQEHLGIYTLVAENIRGTAQCSGRLGLEEKPSPMPSPYSVSPVIMSPKPRPHVEPPHFSKTVLSVVTSEGEEARFEGVVTGIPTPDVTWSKDGKELSPHEYRMSYINGKVTLVIPRVSTEHTGKYTCSAKNEGGLATSSAQLVVTVKKEAPDFIERLISKEVQEGTALRWQVKVSGEPSPSVTWMRNNIPITNCPEVQLANLGNNVHVLYIPRCETADSGQFTCKAENEAGEARSTADLVVRGKNEPPKVYYHVTRVFQQQQDMGVEMSRYQAGPVSNNKNNKPLSS